jgi:hypothetical protein
MFAVNTKEDLKMEWNNAKENKPKQGERVLLKIKYEECPVVGFWGTHGFDVCTVNLQVGCGNYCQGGSAESNFKSEEVTHWCEILNIPQD